MRTLILLSLVATTAAVADPPPQLLTLQPDQKYYPADAAAQKVDGKVMIKLTIEPTGQISCAILDKTAPQLLKRRSCEVVVQHWNLAPDMKDGAIVKTEIQANVLWKLPSDPDAADFGGAVAISPDIWIAPLDYPAAARAAHREGSASVRFDITPAGHAEHCASETGAPVNEFSAAACRAIEKRARFLPVFDDKGEPIATIGHKRVVFSAAGR